ncbi:putative Ig domain-containing protein [Spirosoma profusum]|nr:putative Ig domain-containing protein [Spirosoma profusum]
MGDTWSFGKAVEINTDGVRIEKSTISNSEAIGIRTNASSLTITTSNVFGNLTGIYNSTGKPTLQNNKIYSNTDYGINNGGSETIDARNTYWGSPTGPLHSTLNPNGKGNKVSDRVLFTPWVDQVIQVDQTINFAEIPNKYVGDTLVLTATATSALPVSFSMTTQPVSNVAVLTGNKITFPGAVGQVTVTAYQAGNEYFKPVQLQRTFTVSNRDQSITFKAIPTKTVGDAPFSLTATSTSGLPVSFIVLSGPATLNGNTLTLTGAGTVVVEARQPGNGVYNPASSLQRSFVVVLPVLSITNLPTSSSEGQTVTFRVATNPAPTSPLTVFLQSSNPTRFPVPASVTIAAGALSTNVSVTLAQDSIPEIDLAVTITAGASNYNQATGTILVKDDDLPNLELVILASNISESAGANATQAILRRTSSSSIAFTANLSANLPNTLVLPSTISLAEGENEKTFTIGVVDNSLLDGQRLVRVTTSLFVSSCGCNAPTTSSGSVSGTVIVNDDDGPSLSLTVIPQTLREGLANAGSLRITRNGATTSALSVTLTSSDLTEATLPATAVIPVGQASIDVAITTLNDGITDGNQNVYFTARTVGLASGSTFAVVTDLNKPDLQIPLVQLSSTKVQAGATVSYQVSVKNSGYTTAPSGILVRGYLSTDNVIDASDIQLSEDTLSEAIPAGQTKILAKSAKAPIKQGVFKLLYWANPNETLTELLFTNNVSAPVSVTIDPAYTVTAAVASLYFLKSTTVPITGSATKTDGSTAANVPVEIYVITNGIRRTLSDTTDASGNFSVPFIPLPSEAGHYVVGASFPGLNQTTAQDGFDILGVRVNGGNNVLFTATQNEILSGYVTVENLSSKSLSNFTLAPVTLPGGATVQFAVLPNVAGNTSVNLGYTVSGTALTSGNNYEEAILQAKSDEGIIQKVTTYYYCQAARAYIVADVAHIQASVSQSSGERRIDVKLINKGKAATGAITINLPNVNWLTSVTSKTLTSLAPGDTAVVVLKFSALSEVPVNNPINGTIGVNVVNGNSFSIPFTFKKVSEATGTARIVATNQFTYNTNNGNGPNVKDALVKITNYFTGELYAQGYTTAEGVFLGANIPEGKHRIKVEKDKHLPYEDVLEINPGATTESTVFLNYQAITFSWNVVPTTVEDQYETVLEATFETNVPIPVVTIEMPNEMPELSTGQSYQFMVTLTNHGLITAEEVTLNLPTTDSEYEFITNYLPGDLLAKQSIQIPVVMRRRSGLPGGRAAAASGSCTDFTGVVYKYKCKNLELQQQTGILFTYKGRACSGGPCYNCYPIGGAAGEGGMIYPAPVKTGKTRCLNCISDIGEAIIGCIPGADIAAILLCYSNAYLDGDDGMDQGVGLMVCAAEGGAQIGYGKILEKLPEKIAKKLPGAQQVFCVYGIAKAIYKCSKEISSGGRVAAGALPNAVLNEISGNLQVVINGYSALRNWMGELFGDLIERECGPILYTLVNHYLDNHVPIPANVQSNIIELMAGYDISPSELSAFFSRWNTSLEAKANNVLAPNATYPNIINWNQVKNYVDTLIQAHNYSVNRGFNTIDGMHKESIKSLNEIIDGEQKGVCASVTVQFNQQLTMTREAFEGTLEIFNGHPTDAMKTISVNIQITDENGTSSNGLFEIQPQNPANPADINAQQKGSTKFLFIPRVDAAPQTSKVYKFGGSVTYWDPYVEAMVTMPLTPVPITVNPSPNLMLHYFIERNILGDDALTSQEVEPSVPAELAVMVENKGYGPARDMIISSAQPKIVENDKGLLIDFKLISSNIQGQPVQLGLTNINFGTIEPLRTKIGQWYFTSSLLGKFVSYDAKVVHKSSFGNKDLSLVQGVQLHELTKSIRLYGELEDGITDFLVNDIFDVNDVPDIIYFSQGNRTAKVSAATSGSFSAPVSGPTFTNTLTVTPSEAGFNYVKLPDPGNRLYELVSVTRSDGQIIPLNNAWLTFVTLPVLRSPVYENKFHFVDNFASTASATYTVVWKPKDMNVPKVDSISGAPTQVSSTQVKNLKIYFNKRIDPATFTYEDMTLSLQGGQNIMSSSVVITQLDSASFNIDLTAITTGSGQYVFTAQAANVKDVQGISGTSGKQVSWSQFISPISFTGLNGTYCSNATSQTLVGAPAGGTFSGPGISGNIFNPVVAGVGSHTITYSKDGQSFFQTTVVNTVPNAIISPASTTLTCAKPTASLTAVSSTTGLSYHWQGPNSFTATGATATINTTGIYSMTAVAAGGCGTVASTTVTSNTAGPTATLTVSGTLTCAQTSVTLTAGGGSNYQFAGSGVVTMSGNQAVVNRGGTYSVTVTGANGCTASQTTTVFASTAATAVSLTASGQLSCSTTSVRLTATAGFNTYLFSQGATQSTGPSSSSALVNAIGTYSVTAINAAGCSSTATVNVTYQNCPPTIANAINPQSATIGQAFSLNIPANTFTDAETPNSLTLFVSGVPAGLSFTAPATISGTPSTTVGSPFSVTVSATDPGGLTARTSFNLTVNPAATTPSGFTITGVNLISCSAVASTQRRVVFNPVYSGLTGQPISFSVVNEQLVTTNPGPYTLNLYTDNPVIQLRAIQQGSPQIASYSYNWLGACTNSNCTQMVTVKAGPWNDPTVWSCGRIPVNTDVVTISHAVSLPASYQGQALRVIYNTTGRLLFNTDSRLRLNGN